ncbi:hypothetical protein DMP15_29790 [Pseudonocardia sp. UM4_GMWB1]|uniref:hypothetical protein n=1 Tax=Pseudonocardia sp. UM4_GMWB1 TaxID=2212989 RepID=UPI00307CECD7
MNNVHWVLATGRVRTLGCDEATEALRPAEELGLDEAVLVIGDDDDIAVHGTKDELQAMLTRLQDQVEQITLAAAPRGEQVEYVEEAWDEVHGSRFDPVCPCGNEPAGSGFYFADRDGTAHSFDDPPEGWRDHQTMGCPECGRFFRQVEHDERGYPVAGFRPVDRSVDIAYAASYAPGQEKSQVNGGRG